MYDKLAKVYENQQKLNTAVGITLQYAKFGAIGLAATAVHVGIFIMLIERLHIWETLANVIAFSTAVMVSFVGNSLWTFKKQRSNSDDSNVVIKAQLLRFWLASFVGLLLNTAIVFLVVDIWQAQYYYAIGLMVSLTPLSIFMIMKLWVFK